MKTPTGSKGTDFQNVPEKEVALVVKKLNNRPRKCLNYQTPHEVFQRVLRGAL
jgi:IS30 family transposase